MRRVTSTHTKLRGEGGISGLGEDGGWRRRKKPREALIGLRPRKARSREQSVPWSRERIRYALCVHEPGKVRPPARARARMRAHACLGACACACGCANGSLLVRFCGRA
eukprot:5727784-Pleurochrysis_carterae.AAC.3